MRPAVCGGITFATAASKVSSAVFTVRLSGSTASTPPVKSSGSHSIMPG
jgi:hypothetical protein